MDWFLIFAGLTLLFFGGEIALRSGVALARLFGVSPAIIGLTVIGFGTSLPELFVTLQASLNGQPDLALGNVVGSNIANVLLILGLSGIFSPLTCPPKTLSRDGTAMLLAGIVLAGLTLSGEILRWQGVVMFATIVLFVSWSWLQDRKEQAAIRMREQETNDLGGVPGNLPLALLLTVLGLAALTGGAHLLVTGAVGIAMGYGVSEAVIGLSLLAIGTSLPELTASLVAARRGHGDMAVANIIGSSIFNILFILGTTVMVVPLPVNQDIAHLDIWVMLAAMLLLFFLLRGDGRICRKDAVVLLGSYVTYIALLGLRISS